MPGRTPTLFREPALPPSPRSIQATAWGCDPIDFFFTAYRKPPRRNRGSRARALPAGRGPPPRAAARALPAGQGLPCRRQGGGERAALCRTYIDSEPTSPGALRGTWLVPRRNAAPGRTPCAPCRQGRATSAAAGGRARPAGRGAVRRAGGKGGGGWRHIAVHLRTYIDSESTSPGALRGTWLLPPRRKAAVGRAHEANRARHAHVALEPAPHHGVNGVPFIAGVGVVGTGGTYLDDPVVLEADLAQPAAAAKWVVGAW